uniref:Uncharacterized protein n=1 Tax=Romanomermis culicivorax TaxID=13658 RepID=A0A915LC50_ROMCU
MMQKPWPTTETDGHHLLPDMQHSMGGSMSKSFGRHCTRCCSSLASRAVINSVSVWYCCGRNQPPHVFYQATSQSLCSHQEPAPWGRHEPLKFSQVENILFLATRGDT